MILSACRILVVEDEFLVATELADWLKKLGAEVVGPFGRLAPAHAAAREEALDGAILDVRLDGERTFEVVEELLARGVPVILATGFRDDDLPPTLRLLPALRKPYGASDVTRMVEAHFVRA